MGITGDGATILGKYSRSQFAAAFKPLDEDAIDTLTGEHIYYDMIMDQDGNERKVFKITRRLTIVLLRQ